MSKDGQTLLPPLYSTMAEGFPGIAWAQMKR